jgi:hypothetical protein
MGVQPLHGLGRTGDHRRRLAEFDRERLNDLDLGPGEPVEHRRELSESVGPGGHPDALAGLAGVVQLELVFLRDDLLGEGDRGVAAPGCGTLRRRRRSGGIGGIAALEEVERHDRLRWS